MKFNNFVILFNKKMKFTNLYFLDIFPHFQYLNHFEKIRIFIEKTENMILGCFLYKK
jgi:hypothetical protein